MKRLLILLYATFFGATAALASGRPLSDCTHAARLEVAGYAGAETLTGVPVLVRLSEAIPGFHYADCGADGAGLVFCDEANEVVFPHEIDEWNPDGESLVWVRLPSLAAGTAFQMGWGGTAAAPDPHTVWSDYAGVWHMNEDSGTAFDSTTNGLHAVPTHGTNTAWNLSEMVSYPSGACGRARTNGNANGRGNNYMAVASSPVLHFGNCFMISGWFRANGIATDDDPRLVSKKSGLTNPWNNETGFEINYENSLTNLLVRGGGNSKFQTPTPMVLTTWVHLDVAYDGTTVSVYTNGVFSANGTVVSVLDNDDILAFGGNEASFSLNGQYDEIRLRSGTLSADRIQADYDMVANRDFLTYTPNPTSDDLVLLAEGDLAPGVSIRLGGVPDGWTLHYTTDGSTPTADSPVYEEPFTLAGSATVKAVAVNDNLGWTTDVAEQRFDLAPPLAVTGAQASQRYPWNGLVDVDFTLVGDTAKCYRVSVEATDLDGGTNLLAATVWEDGGAVTNAALDLAPGEHRLVWNAGADLPEGFVADNVAVSLRAEYLHDTALYMVVDLSGGPDAAHYPVSYLPDVPEGGWTDEYKTEKLVLRRVEPGSAETCGEPMFAAVFEMTQGQYENITGTNATATFVGDRRPVRIPYDMIRGTSLGSQWPTETMVDANSFLALLRTKTLQQDFDLPTTNQWEYVCRAGTVTDLNNGKNLTSTHEVCSNANEVARYFGNSGWRWYNGQSGTISWGDWDGKGGFDAYSEVGAYRPNAWGLYDTHGNVWEWCLDSIGTDRVVNGGAQNSPPIGLVPLSIQHYPSNEEEKGFRLFLHDAPAVVEAPIVAPEGLTATTNRTGDVTLAWDPVAGAYAYLIRRSKTGAFEDGTWLNTVTNTTYADWTAEARTDYTYWVRAQFESGKVGRWSEAAEGCRSSTYIVKFNANGGSGTMADQTFTFDVEQQLSAKTFSRDGFKFSGWATTASGPKVYSDKQSVKNLTSGSTITLYAVWERLTAQNSLYMVIDLSSGANSSSYPISYLENVPSGGWTDTYKTTKVVLRRIEPGTFTMGSPSGERGRNGSRETQHQVTLTKPFYIGVFEFTQKQWSQVMGSNPSLNKGNARPVEYVSYNDIRGTNYGKWWPVTNGVDAASFMGKFRQRTGLEFDLPTSAQWEYACRAGTTTALNSGKNLTSTEKCANLGAVARYSYNTNDGKGGYSGHTKVGCYAPNSWGLYDMHGNVWEWCLDWYKDYGSRAVTDPVGTIEANPSTSSTGDRIVRGGCYYGETVRCRSAEIGFNYPNWLDGGDGFRICLTGEPVLTLNPLGTAIDCSEYEWETSSLAWSVVDTTSYQGNTCAQSGGGGDTESDSWIRTTVSGNSKTMTFQFQKSYVYATFTVEIDGQAVFTDNSVAHPSDIAWIAAEVTIPAGTHEVKFNYHHPGQGWSGQFNGVRVDSVSFVEN